ncbi:Hypothetical predicted protein [Mytilus galloprovincialis]|uniref:Tyr recombinase domain-containing protein n=1 Tax=Mytilus galloprovincialis TaxID=29158 RepID=A0A8B6GIQ6_MYTGA|nr:Hypothetical predicted protein [Mytilus galloprovincialis]
MGPVTRRPTGQPQYDPVLKENWTLLRLRQEVTRLKLNVPKNAKRLTLVRILNSVENSSHSDNTTETVDISDIADEANTIYGGARSHNAPVRNQEDHVAPTTTSSNEGRTLINLVSRLSSTVQSLQQNVSALNGKVNSLLVVQPNTRQEEVAVPTFTSTGSGHSEDINNSGNSHNLESAYASLNRTTMPAAAAGSANQEARSVRTSRGYSAETLPFVETISPQLRKNIISDGEISKAGTKSRSDTHTLPSSSSFDDGLIKQVEELWEASLCISTRKTYNSGFLCFKTFMAMTNQHHINSVPIIDEDCLIYFVTYCKNSLKLAHATIKLYLAGIRHNYLRIEHPDPLSNCARLECILRGIKKSQNNVKQKRLPITSQILKQLCCMLQQGVFSPFVDLMLQCSFNLAFFGFLRCGEFTYSSKIARQDTLLIQNIDFDLNFQNFTVHLNSSKCDPFREGINITIFENDIFSPVDLMRRYIQVRKNHGARPDSYLFVNDEYNNAPLSRDTFIARLRESLFRLGYNDSKFCGHSFRIGAATSAAAAGVEDHIIQTLGRWSSDCYIRYIRN